MKIDNPNCIFRINSLFIIVFLFIQLILVFIIDTKLNLIEMPGVVYLESKSLFPIQTFNSISATIILGKVLFLFNIFPYFYVIKNFIKSKNTTFFDEVKNYKILYWIIGYQNLSPFRIINNIKKATVKFKIILILFIFYAIFLFCYWLFGFSFIEFPAPYLLVAVISKFKIFLLLFNILLFILISFFLLACISNVFLILYSFFNKNFIR